MSINQPILILGAGELGLSIIKNLVEQSTSHQSTKITVLLRPATINSKDTKKAQEVAVLKALGVELLPGDLVEDTQVELTSLFKPYHTIISCTGFVAGSGTQLKIARAVLEAGVPRYFPWQFGVDYDVVGRGSAQDLFDEQLDIRDLLRGQEKTEWVIVSTGIFMSFLFESFFGVVDLDPEDHGRPYVRALGSWDTEVTVTAVEDIGNLTAKILFTDPPSRNEVVYIAGDTISYGRLKDMVKQEFGPDVRDEVWSVEHLMDELKKDPENPIKKYRAVFAAGKGVAWDRSNTFNAQKGVAVTDVPSYAKTRV